jgi:hypothetical protein
MSALDLALRLIEHGIPVVVVKPGDKPPSGWQHTPADPSSLKGFREGKDALAAVSGCGVDGVDVDTKAGGSVDNLPPFKSWGMTTTPSGGAHYIVPSCYVGKISPLRTKHGPVGDYAGGRLDGSGRMLLFLPGSVRTKYPDGGYVETVPWDIEGCLAAEPDPDLVDALLEAGGSFEEPHVYVDRSQPRDPEAGLHPYAQKAIEAELKRLDECDALGWDGPPWDSTTFAVACNLVEFANSAWSGYTLERAYDDLMSRAPSDEGFTARDHEAKWASALNTVAGGARREPDNDSGFDVVTEHEIFDASPVLQHIRQAAHSRLVGSGALLCYVLGRVLAEAPPTIVLPAVIGSAASLNLAFALVGRSGDGKSTTSKASAELLGITQDAIETGIGSGEGLMESYLEMVLAPDPNDPTKTIRVKQLVDPPSRILEVDEIGQLGAVSVREGSSMMSVLRSALTGGALKSANAAVERRRNIDKGTYRLVAFVGVQPELSGILLNDAGAGTPQRFVWVSVVDRTLPEQIPAWPGSLDWTPTHLEFAGDHEVQYPDHVREEIVATRYKQVKEGLDPLRGHQLLTQLKVAAALAFLHGELDISEQWWRVAGKIMRWSMKEQQRCLQVLGEKGKEIQRKRGAAAAEEEEAKASVLVQYAAEAILKKVESGMEWWRDIVKSIRHNHRPFAEDALEELIRTRRVVVESADRRGNATRRVVRRGTA